MLSHRATAGAIRLIANPGASLAVDAARGSSVRKRCLILFLFICMPPATDRLAAQPASGQLTDPQQLPSILVSYALLASTYSDFPEFLRSPQGFSLQRDFRRLDANLDAVNANIPLKMGFTRLAFVIRGDVAGSSAGCDRAEARSRRAAGTADETTLFVSTPLKSLGDRVLAILSSVRPDQAAIVTLDKSLRAELIYDSFKKNGLRGGDRYAQMGFVRRVSVTSPGKFVLEEEVEPGGRGSALPLAGRVFIVDTTSGKVEVQLRKETAR